MIKIAVIDNYDSFTYNLVHYLEALDATVVVYRNDEFELAELEPYSKILLSPGPGLPSEAGLLKQVIKTYAASKSILGICLGLQAIVEVFNGKLINLKPVLHGVSSKVTIKDKNEPLFHGINSPFEVGHYHSWAMDPLIIPNELLVTSTSEDGHIMSIRHQNHDVKGVQFHPESILTPQGLTILKNWVEA
jgi:anthranilate synthase component 2